ncbi:MAG: sigma-70 family RNA polymerase sigma factor [Candidatus Omnitrophica bacterium]|nr:sigma-70 family RNA polymerase sigma factor [Candidatus Omnitrophota bacterium]
MDKESRMVPSEDKKKNTLSSPDKWVDLYGNYLYRFALGRLRNPNEAENIVQETFLAALTARERFAGKSSERTWLIGILKHKVIDHFRKNYRERPVTDLTDNEKAIDTFYDHVGHPNRSPSDWMPESKKLLDNKEFWEAFHKCLNKLPQATHQAFVLRELESLEGKKICETLNISQSNLWVMLHRARLQLRECLETSWFEKKQAL